LFDLAEEVESLLVGEEAGLDGVGGELAHLVEGEVVELASHPKNSPPIQTDGTPTTHISPATCPRFPLKILDTHSYN
jgi:hypothetical protein